MVLCEWMHPWRFYPHNYFWFWSLSLLVTECGQQTYQLGALLVIFDIWVGPDSNCICLRFRADFLLYKWLFAKGLYFVSRWSWDWIYYSSFRKHCWQLPLPEFSNGSWLFSFKCVNGWVWECFLESSRIMPWNFYIVFILFHDGVLKYLLHIFNLSNMRKFRYAVTMVWYIYIFSNHHFDH